MAQSSESDVIAGRRVLVIEDEYLIALEVQRILEEAGAREVVLVARAAEALTALGAAEPFDMAVLDVRLGDESGEPVARTLEERGIPFVIVTGLASEGPVLEGFGHIPVLEKPYDAGTLVQTLVEAVRAARR